MKNFASNLTLNDLINTFLGFLFLLIAFKILKPTLFKKFSLLDKIFQNGRGDINLDLDFDRMVKEKIKVLNPQSKTQKFEKFSSSVNLNSKSGEEEALTGPITQLFQKEFHYFIHSAELKIKISHLLTLLEKYSLDLSEKKFVVFALLIMDFLYLDFKQNQKFWIKKLSLKLNIDAETFFWIFKILILSTKKEYQGKKPIEHFSLSEFQSSKHYEVKSLPHDQFLKDFSHSYNRYFKDWSSPGNFYNFLFSFFLIADIIKNERIKTLIINYENSLEILSCDRQSTLEEVKKKYKHLTKYKHPDMISNILCHQTIKEEGLNQFLKIKSAYDYLLSNHKRQNGL